MCKFKINNIEYSFLLDSDVQKPIRPLTPKEYLEEDVIIREYSSSNHLDEIIGEIKYDGYSTDEVLIQPGIDCVQLITKQYTLNTDFKKQREIYNAEIVKYREQVIAYNNLVSLQQEVRKKAIEVAEKTLSKNGIKKYHDVDNFDKDNFNYPDVIEAFNMLIWLGQNKFTHYIIQRF